MPGPTLAAGCFEDGRNSGMGHFDTYSRENRRYEQRKYSRAVVTERRDAERKERKRKEKLRCDPPTASCDLL